MGKNILAFVLAPVHTDGSFDTEGDNLKFELEDNLTGLAGKTQVYAFDIEFAGAYEIDAEFNDDGNDSFAYLNIYDETGKKVTGSNGIYNLKSGKYFFVVSIPENADKATFTVVPAITMLPVPAGSFQRDGTATNISEIKKSYYLSKYQITRQQFLAIMRDDPSTTSIVSGTTDDEKQRNPVQNVNWYHAIAFCNKLSLLEGLTPVYTVEGVDDWENLAFEDIPLDFGEDNYDDWEAVECDWTANGYRLPTEMEWMWAAMGADKDARPGAIDAGGINRTGYSKEYAGEGHGTGTSIDDYAWYKDNSDLKTHPVGEKLPNELGLHDMSGNVNEWCWDWKADYPADTLTDYRGAGPDSYRVSRGGSCYYEASNCTVAYRSTDYPYNPNSSRGFRVARNGE